MLASACPKKVRGPAAVAAELEIGADDDAAHGERLDQETPHKILRLDLAEQAIERHDHEPVEPERLGEARLGLGIGQPKHEGIWREDVARMRLERQDDRRRALRPGRAP